MRFSSPTHAVIIPGTGSDEVFVRAAFSRPLADIGVQLIAPEPVPGPGLVDGYRTALDSATESNGMILVGGVSLGAHIAAEWALRHQDRCAGLFATLPGWIGAPGDSPAAIAARYGASTVRAMGMTAALDTATDGVPGWLADQLRRAWPRYGTRLAESMLAAAELPAPDAAALATLRIPAAVVGCVDDPVHPIDVARQWSAALPGAPLTELRLADLGADLENLGRSAVNAWRSGRPR